MCSLFKVMFRSLGSIKNLILWGWCYWNHPCIVIWFPPSGQSGRWWYSTTVSLGMCRHWIYNIWLGCKIGQHCWPLRNTTQIPGASSPFPGNHKRIQKVAFNSVTTFAGLERMSVVKHCNYYTEHLLHLGCLASIFRRRSQERFFGSWNVSLMVD